MKKRIYAVAVDGLNLRLVRASHPNTALMHVVRGMATARVADQDTLVQQLTAGNRVEEASGDLEEPPAEGANAPLWADPAAAAATPPPRPAEPAPTAPADPASKRGRRAAAPAQPPTTEA